jgi:hypothetical protein
VAMRLNVQAAGTAPTTARAGIADSTGKILALSGNVNAAANWVAGASTFPFASPYTILADGGYYACMLVNGSWGTTQPTALRGAGASGTFGALGSAMLVYGIQTGQTDLPSVGSSMTLSAGGNTAYYMAFY